MKETLIARKTAQEVINIGWNTLTKELGPVGAAKFWMYVTHGEGNSVEEYKKMWNGKSIEEIHREILKAKRLGKI
jgi:hypothetical protein